MKADLKIGVEHPAPPLVPDVEGGANRNIAAPVPPAVDVRDAQNIWSTRALISSMVAITIAWVAFLGFVAWLLMKLTGVW
jgi:hypothetical protein